MSTLKYSRNWRKRRGKRINWRMKRKRQNQKRRWRMGNKMRKMQRKEARKSRLKMMKKKKARTKRKYKRIHWWRKKVKYFAKKAQKEVVKILKNKMK